MLQLIRYIANNPVKADMVKQPSDYRWSAHMEIVASRQIIVAKNRLFEIIGGTENKGEKAYHALIADHIDSTAVEPVQSEFVRQRRVKILESLLIDALGNHEYLTLAQVRSSRHFPQIVAFRRIFAGFATKHGYSTSEIAIVLNISERSVRGLRGVPGTFRGK
jgi:hypothetical protein